MTENRKKWDAPLTDDELEQFIGYLNDNSDAMSDARLGNEIEFMVRNGFDPAILYGQFCGAAVDEESPLRTTKPYENYNLRDDWATKLSKSGRDEDYLRIIFIQTVDYYRKKWGHPALSDQDKENWPKVPVPAKNWHKISKPAPKGWCGSLQTIELTEEQIESVANYMLENYREIVAWNQAILKLAEKQGYKDFDEIRRTGIFESYLTDSIAAIFTLNYDEMVGYKSIEKIEGKLNKGRL
ncbi:hypothetical protein ACFOWX_03335 [Sphingorhabdus arenilitoris]|uniref:Uncharacterized protein n=1 Tax=Sphingorhabdus arenilitoris TaxID=1490041 RepID=A0ABV8RDY2_9SPHN